MTSPRIVVCGAGVIGASVAYFLASRGASPVVVDRARPGAAASGRAAGFLALDWSAGTPLDGLMRASFALHREIAERLGAERLGYRPMEALMTAAADEGSVDRYRRLESPGVARRERRGGILNAPATGRMISEMVLDGGSHSLDAAPFALTRLPAGRLA